MAHMAQTVSLGSLDRLHTLQVQGADGSSWPHRMGFTGDKENGEGYTEGNTHQDKPHDCILRHDMQQQQLSHERVKWLHE